MIRAQCTILGKRAENPRIQRFSQDLLDPTLEIARHKPFLAFAATQRPLKVARTAQK
jgi:hypothetical protein